MSEKPRTVVHLSTVHPSHDNRIFRRECRSLARQGYEVTLVAVADQGREEDGVRVIPLPARRRWRRILLGVPDALRVVWRLRADVYHLHDPELIPIIPVLRLGGSKVIYDAHEDLPVQILDKRYLPAFSRRPLSVAARALCWFADRSSSHVVAATPKVADRFRPRHTTVVYNYPDLSPEPAVQVRSDQPRSVAIYVGAISTTRGAIQMIDAMEQVRLDHRGGLLLVGPSAEAGLIEALKQRPGWGHVDYRGWVKPVEACRLMATAAVGLVVLQPTAAYVDALPTKLFEYMAAGIPVIASDFPLWRNIVREYDCGLLVDPSDSISIAATIQELADDPARAKAMGERGRRAVQERFNWQRQGEMIGALYDRLVGDQRTPVSSGL